MAIWDRLMTSFRAGYSAYMGFNQAAFLPSALDENWDLFTSRLFRYHHLNLYHHNKIYSDLEHYVVQHLKNTNHGLYRSTRGVYNPKSRLDNIYAALVYGGALDMETLRTGAIPITGGDDRLIDALRQLWEWSNLATVKSNIVRTGSKLGDVMLNLVDDREKQKVYIEVLHPGLFPEIEFDSMGNVKSCTIAYQKTDPRTQRVYLFQQRITKKKFATFKDDKPFAFYNDRNGKPVAEWDNEYDFVPVVHIPHLKMEKQFGMAAGYNILEKIDEMNSVASRGHDQIAKTVNAMYQHDAGKAAIEFTANEDKGNVPLIGMPEGKELKPLVTNVDLMAVDNAVQQVLKEVERDTPELALHRIRESGNITAPGVRAGFADAIGLIKEATGNYNGGLIRAHKMGMTMGAIGGYKNFEGFTIDSYDNGDLEHSIADRPVIDDTLSKSERITFLMQVKDQPPTFQQIILQELGVSDDQIEQAALDAAKMKEDLFEQQLVLQETANAGALSGLAAMNARRNGVQSGNGNGAVLANAPVVDEAVV